MRGRCKCVPLFSLTRYPSQLALNGMLGVRLDDPVADLLERRARVSRVSIYAMSMTSSSQLMDALTMSMHGRGSSAYTGSGRPLSNSGVYACRI